MTFPEWTKAGLYGALAGAVAISILGFTWGGWTTAANAEKTAQTLAAQKVTLAMVPVCLDASAADTERAAKLATLEVSSAFARSKAMMPTGWATFPGSDDPNRNLASACLEALASDGS